MSNNRSGLLASGPAKFAAIVAAVCSLAIGGVLGILASQPKPTKVVLEPINKVARDSWIHGGIDTSSGDESAVGTQYRDYHAGSDVPDARRDQVSATLAGRTVSGGSAGVYGGTRDTQVCDKTRLSDFLSDSTNAALAKSWAGVLGLQPGQVTNYLTGLTGARLRWDTRLTDTGIADAKVRNWQALLQAGTAVLVDNTGVPRVKCDSGSPLLSPEGLRNTNHGDLSIKDVASNPGDSWSGLNPHDVVSIQPGRNPLQTLTIVDPGSNELLQRDVGSDGKSSLDVGTGDVQFNLKWTSRADLDLHVIDPDGNTYGFQDGYYKGDVSDNGGSQDVDANVGCDTSANDSSGFAKENIFWPPGKAPSGTYTVYVRGWNLDFCDPPQTGSFTLTVTIGGQVHTLTGTVGQYAQNQSDPSPGGVGDSEVWHFTKP